MSVVVPKNVFVCVVLFTQLFMISLVAARHDKSSGGNQMPDLCELTDCCVPICRVGLPLILLFFIMFISFFTALALILDFRRPRMVQGAKHVLHGARTAVEQQIVVQVATSLAFLATIENDKSID